MRLPGDCVSLLHQKKLGSGSEPTNKQPFMQIYSYLHACMLNPGGLGPPPTHTYTTNITKTLLLRLMTKTKTLHC